MRGIGYGAKATCIGLNHDIDYTFSVYASNAAGDGPPAISNSVRPVTKPGAPLDVTATPEGDASVIVRWTAPDDNGGSNIIKYTVIMEPKAGVCDVSDTETKATCTGLSNGLEYQFFVYATNAVGDGPSASSSPTIPFTVPGTPSMVTASPGNGSVKVSWKAPNDGGSEITSYTVTIMEGSVLFRVLQLIVVA